MAASRLLRSCRACMNENPAQLFDWNSLVCEVDVQLSYAECFQKCTLLDATEDLPQVMCYDCGFELREAYLFITKARKTHRTLWCIQEMCEKQAQEEDVTVDIETTTKECQASEFLLCDPVECADDTGTLSPMPDIETEEHGSLDEAPPSPELAPAFEDVEQTEDDKRILIFEVAADEEHNKEAGDQEQNEVAADQKQKEKAPCKICNKMFPKKWLNSHVAQVHVEKNWLCHICSRSYKTQHSLRRHCATIHEGSNKDSITCELCGRKFARRVCYKTHLMTHNKNRKATFSCDECNKSFFTKNGLTWHKKFHTGDTVNCKLCDKPFARAVDLKKHMLYHSNVKPFKCPECDECFRDVYALNQHLRTKHQGFMYKCDFCDKEYGNVSSLDKHRSIHVGMPNQCGICSKGFWNKPKLVEHLKRHHQIAANELEAYVVYNQKVYRPRHRHVLQIKPKNAENL